MLCATSVYLPLNVGLELGQFHQKTILNNIEREKNMSQRSVTQVETLGSSILGSELSPFDHLLPNHVERR